MTLALPIDTGLAIETTRDDLLALQPDLIVGAMKLSRDPNEAHQLVHLTFLKALEEAHSEPEQGSDLRPWLFGLMRRVFHSVERQRAARRERGFTIASRQAQQEQGV